MKIVTKITCPKCGQKLQIPKRFTFDRGRCPKCWELILNPNGKLALKNRKIAGQGIFPPFFRYFDLRFDELTIFLISASFVLLVFFNIVPVSRTISSILSKNSKIDLFYLLATTAFFPILFFGGLSLGIYHVFTDRKKKTWKKSMMFWFSVVINFITGSLVAHYIISQGNDSGKWWFYVCPV